MTRSVLAIGLCLALCASAEQACDAESSDDTCSLMQGSLRLQTDSEAGLANAVIEGLADTVKALDTATWELKTKMDKGVITKEDFQKQMGKWLMKQAAQKAMSEVAKKIQAKQPEHVEKKQPEHVEKPKEDAVKPLSKDAAANMRNFAQIFAKGHGEEKTNTVQKNVLSSLGDSMAKMAKAAALERAATEASNKAADKAQESLDAMLQPLREKIDEKVSVLVQKATKKLKVDENLHTKRTMEALVDSAVAIWQNLRGETNDQVRHEAIMRLVDEIEMQSQPAAVHHRITHDVDRYLRGEIESFVNYAYAQTKQMTYNTIKKAGAEK